jgi:hypothetical protein
MTLPEVPNFREGFCFYMLQSFTGHANRALFDRKE